jgi:hypothetical protein
VAIVFLHEKISGPSQNVFNTDAIATKRSGLGKSGLESGLEKVDLKKWT